MLLRLQAPFGQFPLQLVIYSLPKNKTESYYYVNASFKINSCNNSYAFPISLNWPKF